MAVINKTNVIGGVGLVAGHPGYIFAGSPGTGTDAVQTITTTGTPTGGTFRLMFEGVLSGQITHTSSAAALDTILEAMPNIGASGVTCAGGALPTGITVTFNSSKLGRKLVGVFTIVENLLTGGTNPTPVVTNTTPGVTAEGRGATTGAIGVRVDTGVQLTNTSATPIPTWVSTGGQT